MIMIKKLKLWKDPRYTEECVEIPPKGSRKLPPADWVNQHEVQHEGEEPTMEYYDLRPRKGSTLSALELPLSFSETWDMSYLWMQAEDDAGQIEVFGWIRSVEQIAGSSEAVRIVWVPDYWRTFSGSLTFGRGVVTKTSNSTYARPLRVQPRQWRISSRMNIGNDTDATKNAIILSYVKNTKDGQGQIIKTEIIFLWWYLGAENTPSLTDIYAGLLEDDLGLDPDSIVGAWLSPVAPVSVTGTYTHGTYTVNVAGVSGSGGNAHSFRPAYTVDSTHRLVVSDYMGAIMGEVPYGFTIDGYSAYCDYGSSGCNVIINFTTNDNRSGATQPEIGLRVTMPCPNLPITSNAWSSYVYSGQRENDIQLRIINRDQKAVAGITGSTNSAVSGALTGALVGTAGGPIGAGVGAAVGLGSALLGVGIDYLSSGYFDDKLQAETDKLYSNQAANVLLPASGSCWNVLGNGTCAVVFMIADSISRAEMDAFIINQGYDVEIPAASVSSFLIEGPVQIRNLMLRGAAPAAAKSAIKGKLEAGVFIVENNNSGTDPAN